MYVQTSVRRAQEALGHSTLLEEHLVDLMHWARIQGVPFVPAVTEARRLYVAERKGHI